MAEKKEKKRDFSKLKGKTSKFLKSSAKVIKAIIGITSVLAFIAVPFLHNKIDTVVAK